MTKSGILAGIDLNYNNLLENAFWITDIQMFQALGILGFSLPMGKYFSIRPRFGGGIGVITYNSAKDILSFESGVFIREYEYQFVGSSGISLGIDINEQWALRLYPEYRFLANSENLSNAFSLQFGAEARIWTAISKKDKNKEDTVKIDTGVKNQAVVKPAATPKASVASSPAPKTVASSKAAQPVKAVESAKPSSTVKLLATTQAVATTKPAATPLPAASPKLVSGSSVGQGLGADFSALDKYPNIRVSQRGKLLRISIESMFESSSSALGTSVRNQLTSIGIILSKLSISELRVEGYAADDKALETKNAAELSTARAQVVKDFILRGSYLSAPGLGIQALGLGIATPVADNGNLEGRKRNRRAEILITLK